MATLAFLAGTVLGVGHGAAPAVAGAGPVAVGAVNAGWFDDTGFHAEWNTSYGVGPTGMESFHGGRIRNFFVFDLSGLTGQVVSAELVPRPGAATTVTSPPTTRAAAPTATAPTTAPTRAVPSTTAGSPTTTETTATTATTAATPPTSMVHAGGRVVLAGSSGEDGAGAGGIAVGGFLVLGAFLLLRWKFT